MNLITEIPAFIGIPVGIALGSHFVSYISLVVAGMFLYISAYAMLTLMITVWSSCSRL